MNQYSLRNELSNNLKIKLVALWLLVMFIPIVYYFVLKDSYVFRDTLDIFTFLLEGILVVIFPLLATLIYLPSFSSELNNRFIVYTRLRVSIKKLLFVKFMTNGILTFSVFFTFVFSMFLFSFYISPSQGWVLFEPEIYGLTESTLIEDSYTRHTFTQLLVYGPMAYGLAYSFWVGINAAIYATIGFLSLLLIPNKFVALSIPWLLYIVGSFITSISILRPFKLSDTIFPYAYAQQPIWTAIIPFLTLCCLCLVLFIIIRKKFYTLSDLQ